MSGLGALPDFNASMGPRFRERGRLQFFVQVWAQDLTLQWGRASESAEGAEFGYSSLTDIQASMGPRFRERGRGPAPSLGAKVQ